MSLQFAEKPEKPLAVVTARLATLTQTKGFLTPVLRKIRGQDLMISNRWHRSFYLGLNTLADSERPVQSAPEIGWRFFLEHGEEIVAAIEARRTTQGDDHGYHFGPLTEGPFVRATAKAFDEAALFVRGRGVNYEPTMLFAPALHLAALWLRTGHIAADWIVPVSLVVRRFESFEPLKLDEFTPIVRAVAHHIRNKQTEFLSKSGPDRHR